PPPPPPNFFNKPEDPIRDVEMTRGLGDEDKPLLVIKTRNGYAPGLAYDIDLARCPEILGTIPGADTIFAVLREDVDRKRVKEILSRFMPHGTVYQLDSSESTSDQPPFN
ncbi:MAG: hypothetical protein K2H75_08170, partial [Muribaculaceae bacterium]|nr:hypothetical protein [Muribaculaceae bacterium]